MVDPAPEGSYLMQVYNLAGGNVTVKIPGSGLFPEQIPHLQVNTLSYSPAWTRGSTELSVRVEVIDWKCARCLTVRVCVLCEKVLTRAACPPFTQ